MIPIQLPRWFYVLAALVWVAGLGGAIALCYWLGTK